MNIFIYLHVFFRFFIRVYNTGGTRKQAMEDKKDTVDIYILRRMIFLGVVNYYNNNLTNLLTQ